jgi:hypothetical protein
MVFGLGHPHADLGHALGHALGHPHARCGGMRDVSLDTHQVG